MQELRNFRLGVSRLSRQKNPFTQFFKRKTIILKDSSWGTTFSKGGGGSNFFPGEVGVNADFYRHL